MTATTSPDGIRYPNDTNQPADVPNALQQLALDTQTALNKRMDDIPAAGSVAFDSTSWVAGGPGYGAPICNKTGRLVVTRGLFVRALSDLAVTDNVTIALGTLPAGYEPFQNQRLNATWVANPTGSSTSNISVALLTVWSGGDVQFTPNFTGTIKVGHWISFAGIPWITAT